MSSLLITLLIATAVSFAISMVTQRWLQRRAMEVGYWRGRADETTATMVLMDTGSFEEYTQVTAQQCQQRNYQRPSGFTVTNSEGVTTEAWPLWDGVDRLGSDE